MDIDSLLKDCFFIRKVEEKVIDLYPSDLIQSPVHLSIGQEAVAVGICSALANNSKIFINYRGHAFYLARGGDLKSFFAELMGRQSGFAKGKAGSMHLAAPEVGIMGASAVVASSIPHAVGYALANKLKGDDLGMTAVVFGDGALEAGVVHESLNFASLHGLRVLFICEDNGLAVHARKLERQAFDIKKFVESYGIPYFFDGRGYDPRSIKRSCCESIESVDDGPVFFHVATTRYKEHVGPQDDFSGGYRTEEELAEWMAKDQLLTHREILEREFGEQMDCVIEEAVYFAKNSPKSSPEELLTDV